MACHVSFIQSPILMEIIELDSNSNVVFVLKLSAHSKMLWRFGMHFSSKGLVLCCICSDKFGVFFVVAKPFLDTRNFFQDLF